MYLRSNHSPATHSVFPQQPFHWGTSLNSSDQEPLQCPAGQLSTHTEVQELSVPWGNCGG